MLFDKYPVQIAGFWLYFCLWFVAMAVHADDFAIVQASTHLSGHLYKLDTEIHYQLSDEAVDALHHGISLTLVLSAKVFKKRWLWDENIADIKQRYLLSYQPLTKQYQVKFLNTGFIEFFDSLSLLLVELGIIEGLPLLDEKWVNDKKPYYVELDAQLDIEALPTALRPLAYLSSHWRLSSGVFVCRLAK